MATLRPQHTDVRAVQALSVAVLVVAFLWVVVRLAVVAFG